MCPKSQFSTLFAKYDSFLRMQSNVLREKQVALTIYINTQLTKNIKQMAQEFRKKRLGKTNKITNRLMSQKTKHQKL